MVRSMTGFGRAVGELDGEHVTIELSSVNHRYLDCAPRMPNSWVALEAWLRDQVKKNVARGKVNLWVWREHGPVGRQKIQFDENVAGQYIDAAKKLSDMMHTTEAMSLNTLVQLEGTFFHEEEEQDLDTIKTVLDTVLNEALTQFNLAREKEGAALAADVQERVDQMREALAVVEERLPELSAAYEERLRTRIDELNAEVGLKEERIALEVAMMAEKVDVAEEVVRLKAHFVHCEEIMASTEPVGRDLNFLAQEIQREINTLGSKLRDVDVTREVLRMKGELEKLREQVQNIE